MSGSPAKKPKFNEELSAERTSRSPSPVNLSNRSSTSENVTDSLRSLRGSASIPEIEISPTSSSVERGQSCGPPPPVEIFATRRWSAPEFAKFYADCTEVIRKARSLTTEMDKCANKNFVKNLPENLICQLHEKIYTSWATLHSPDNSSGGSSEGVSDISPDEPKETHFCDLPYIPTTTSIAPTSTILSMVCNELEKLRNPDQGASEASDVAVLIPLTRDDPMSASPSPENLKPSSSDGGPELAPEDMPEPLELLLRLINFSEKELQQNKEKIARARQFLQKPSAVPSISITSTSPDEVTTEVVEQGSPQMDLLQKFRDNLVYEAQKLSNSLKAKLAQQRILPGTSGEISFKVPSCSKEPTVVNVGEYQLLSSEEDSKISEEMEVDVRKTSPDSTSEAEIKDTDAADRSASQMDEAQTEVQEGTASVRSTGPCDTETIEVTSTEDTIRGVPSLSTDDSTPSDVEPIFPDSPATEEESEL